jgi:hypothetical protein
MCQTLCWVKGNRVQQGLVSEFSLEKEVMQLSCCEDRGDRGQISKGDLRQASCRREHLTSISVCVTGWQCGTDYFWEAVLQVQMVFSRVVESMEDSAGVCVCLKMSV